jgi:hypothetical protein
MESFEKIDGAKIDLVETEKFPEHVMENATIEF